MSLYTGSFTDPNGKLAPDDRQRIAFYTNDPIFNVLWSWSVQLQAWIQTAFAAGGNPILEGDAPPVGPPPDATKPAIYVNRTNKVFFAWDTVNEFLI